MYLKMYKKYGAALSCLLLGTSSINAQTDSLFLTVDQLFERGVQHSLQLQADAMRESMAQERTRTARSAQLPELQIGLKGGFVGQPVVWERGLSDPVYPEAPDWSQNYAIDLAQPLYQGGKIRSAIHKADIEKQVAKLQTLTDQAEIKLRLLNQYMNLFSLFKQHEVLARNIEESELRLHDIRRMKKEGLITNNDVLRSEMQLTNDRLSLQEVENSIALVSQQLDILLGQDENLLLKPDTTILYQAVALQPYDDYIVQAYANDPAMKLLRAQTELARNEIRSVKSFSLPSVSLYASNTLARPISRTLADMYNNNWNVFDYNWGGSSALVFTLNIPLYKASNFTKLKTARIQINQLKENRTDTERKLNMQITSYQNNMAASSEQVVSNKENVMQAQKAVEIAGKRYEVGKGTVLELNSSQVSLTQAELTYNQSIYDYLVSKADLDQVLGRDYSTNK